jgi:hypothetical protein
MRRDEAAASALTQEVHSQERKIRPAAEHETGTETSHSFEMTASRYRNGRYRCSLASASLQRRQLMNLKLLTAAAVLSIAVAAPALAQDPHGRSVYHRHSGFWPGEVAAGVVGGAIGTAGAIATAPFRNDVYAYNDGYYGRRTYGSYNSGFVCQPGTMFWGEDGRRHICQ